jgi:predicted DNA-binding protein with PD1-like motif
MIVFRSDDGKAAMTRLLPGTDLLQELNGAAAELGIEAGTLQVVGAVQTLAIVTFNQKEKRYDEPLRYGEMEIAGGVGNVSLKDGKPFVHIHLTGAGPDGKAVAGHLVEGTSVWMIEAYFRKLDGPAPVRELDDEVGLPVWHSPS